MSRILTLDNTEELLERAWRALSGLLVTGKQPVVAKTEPSRVYCQQDSKATIVSPIDNGRWDIAAPVFRGMQDWVEAHWSASRITQSPEGPLPRMRNPGSPANTQLARPVQRSSDPVGPDGPFDIVTQRLF